jgi:integrase
MRQTTLKLIGVNINGEKFYQVISPKPGGGRIRRTFKIREEAEEHLKIAQKQIAAYGAAAMEISDVLRIAAIEADRLLQPFKKTIVEAAQFFVKHLSKTQASVKVSHAIVEFAKASKDCSIRYKRDLTYRLGCKFEAKTRRAPTVSQFEKTFSDRTMSEITTEELDDFLGSLKLGAVSQNTFRRRIITLWTFAAEKKRGWCGAEIATGTIHAKETAKDEVGILTTEELTRLLNAARGKDTLAYWAIAVFAGLRASELERLDWSDVNHDHILVRAKNSKTKTRRAVDLQPNLLRWLELCRDGKTGNVAPRGLREKLLADRKEAGLDKNWKSNCARHSFGSYFLAREQSTDKTAYQMGNTPEIVEGHYRQVVAPADAARYWSIEPNSNCSR